MVCKSNGFYQPVFKHLSAFFITLKHDSKDLRNHRRKRYFFVPQDEQEHFFVSATNKNELYRHQNLTRNT